MKETTEPKYIVRATRLSVLPHDEPLFSEQCTHVSIVDEGGCEFVEVKQQCAVINREQTIRIEPEEWPALKDSITTMINACKWDEKWHARSATSCFSASPATS